jgi:hypothetical protein
VVDLSISDATAVIAILIATLSAIYSKWAWSEAKKANKISLHEHQRHIYEAFYQLKMHMIQRADGADISEVIKFHHPSQNAIFYFDKALASDIAKYHDQCFEIANRNRSDISAKARIELMEEAKAVAEFAKELELKLKKLVSIA